MKHFNSLIFQNSNIYELIGKIKLIKDDVIYIISVKHRKKTYK